MKKYGYGYIFIYNPSQKDFYISEGCQLIDSDVHIVTKRTYWIFVYNDVQIAYKKWMDQKYGA